MPRLLLIDDEPAVCYSFRRVFETDGVSVATASTAQAGLAQARAEPPDVIVLDLQLPDATGLEVFRQLKQDDPRRPVIFITAHGSAETAIEAMKQGAFDYLIKPVDLAQLTTLLGRAFEAARLMREPLRLPTEAPEERIVGRSPAVHELCKSIGRLAGQDVSVLILGESGSGKELVARALYQHGRRADKPFLAINCAAIPEALLESELFGHEKGAFTGADRKRIGKFEQCDGGTLFLDEIGDLSPAVQAKMLRVLQEQQFERVGSNDPVRTRVRVLAATNKDLEAEVAAGRYRKDLYYRLKVITLTVPPLRERGNDVVELAHHFLFRFNRELGLDLQGIDPASLELLRGHPWPGNVRELQSAVKQAMLAARGPILLPEFFPAEIHAGNDSRAPAGETGEVATLAAQALRDHPGEAHAKLLEQVERVLFSQALRQTRGHQAQASDLLGLNRATLRTRLRHLGLGVDRVVVEPPGGDHPG